jgi:DNA-directed RNA polymerase subunit RPC12/RpoP
LCVRTCTVCRKEVELPNKINGDESRVIKCPHCGAKAPLMVKLRNGRVRGLKGCFLK